MASPSIQIQEFVWLAPYTTLRVGGKARYFVEITSQLALLEAVAFARDQDLPIFVLGGGSNLLISDDGFSGLVIHAQFKDFTQIDPFPMLFDRRLNPTSVDVSLGAGTNWDDFVRIICEQGISGVECLAGIPGLVGGSPIQNIGAYGQEVADTILAVTALDLETLSYVGLDRNQCGFGYRSSIFNTTHRGRYIVTNVDFRFDLKAKPELTYADLVRHFAGKVTAPTPIEVYHAVREIRHGKGMLLVEGEPDCRSAGSFFKNPIVSDAVLTQIAESLGAEIAAVPHWPASAGLIKLPAAWLLDQAGFHKGFAMGAAGISSRHTLALINRGDATFADISALRDAIQSEVKRRFGIVLEQEPVQLGG